jgi:CBS domain containing-hemolysin-like protein
MLIRIIILFVLIGINGILSSSEIAFLSLNKYNLSRKKDKKAKSILKILSYKLIVQKEKQHCIRSAVF